MNFENSPERKYEKSRQKEIDDFYKSKGWVIDREVECVKYDLAIMIQSQPIYIEEKFRTKDYKDFGIEIMQDVNTMNMGWYYKTEADRIFQIHDDCLYSVNLKYFKIWLQSNYSDIYLSAKASVKGYGLTLNLYIPWCEIPENIYTRINIHEPDCELTLF